MKSARPKVLHPAGGMSLIQRVLRTAATVNPATVTVVVGHEADAVRAHLGRAPGLSTVVQEPQLGTGHALLQAEPPLEGQTGTVILLSADVPLLKPATLRALLDTHEQSGAAATVVTAMMQRPYGYGRIVRVGGDIARIVEERDASPAEREIKEINAGIYAFDLAPLFAALKSIGAENAQGEYYLPDLVGIYRRQRRGVATWTVSDANEIRGVNSRSELAEVTRMVRQQKNEELMAAGVTLMDPATTYVDIDVQVGADTVLYPGVILEGSTTIGTACAIHAGVRLTNATVGDRVVILDHCVVVDASIANDGHVGPFAHLRPGTVMGEGARVGNFVELKKTTMGAGAKANHLAYIGDATIGEKANIGAGTITCNYDGTHKHQTTVGAGAFVGSNSTLVAPVTIGDNAYVAAGSAITSDVPADALAIGRSRQQNKDGWAKERRDRLAKASE
ncbi:MAG: bifunctional UDP-N-acetylglucosamine diphosphorylase/glucosamine-1-phosphate N-acetyltransferase GlmU [Acidobacteria bacterium]|nr:bifunctional UDP-N-acetylglucosamine diphosphorylase/glucosamine-1-phosphate N-acetyltransferase GlmU [Acidobacteriota bacterium]